MTKTFDAVEMSRHLREQTSRKLSALTREQRLALLNGHIHATRKDNVMQEEPPPYGNGKPSPASGLE